MLSVSSAPAAWFNFDPSAIPTLPEVLIEFLQRGCAQQLYEGPERRSEPHHPFKNLLVLAVPLDEKREPCGEPFLAVSRDISLRGIAIYHANHVNSKVLALEITDPNGVKLQVLMNVLRCQPIDTFFESAGSFTSKL